MLSDALTTRTRPPGATPRQRILLSPRGMSSGSWNEECTSPLLSAVRTPGTFVEESISKVTAEFGANPSATNTHVSPTQAWLTDSRSLPRGRGLPPPVVVVVEVGGFPGLPTCA